MSNQFGPTLIWQIDTKALNGARVFLA